MTQSETMLEPCPFCSGKSEMNVLYEDGTIDMDIAEPVSAIEFVVIRCSECGISKEKPNVADAIKWWNTRTAASLDAGREALRTTLKEHWLTQVKCDHEAHTDTPVCYCCEFICEPKATLGEAVDAWIEHVITLTTNSPAPLIAAEQAGDAGVGERGEDAE
jgi:hypothetical protein